MQLQSGLCSWLTSALSEKPLPDRVAVGWTPDGSSSSGMVETVEIGKATNPADLAQRIETRCAEHSATLGYSTKYTVVAMLGGQSIREYLLAVRQPEPVHADGGDGSMRSSAKLLAKHAADCQRQLATMFEVTVGMMGQEVRGLRERVSELEQGRFKVMETVEELIDRRAERELEAEAARKTEERKDRAFGLLENAAPMILARISGATPAARLVRSLPAEHRAMLLSALDEEQLGLLHELLRLAQAGEQGERRLTGQPDPVPEPPLPPSGPSVIERDEAPKAAPTPDPPPASRPPKKKGRADADPS